MMYKNFTHALVLFVISMFVIACGGGGGSASDGDAGGRSDSGDNPSSPEIQRYNVGGTISGLTGVGLVLQNEGNDDLSIDSNGEFEFATALGDGSSYDVTVHTHPSGQICEVENGGGVIDGADINTVEVECGPPELKAISGLQAIKLVWNAPGAVDIYYSSDPDCDWINYASCPNGMMLPDVEGRSVSLDPVANDLPAGIGLYFQMVDERGVSSGVAGARLLPPAFDREVHAAALYGERLYVGGDFSYVHMATGSGVALDLSSGDPVGSVPFVDGTVWAVVADGADGWYIGGNFEYVNGQSRANLAHIEATGAVDPDWNPGTDNTVYALTTVGDVVYAGGSFTMAGGSGRSRIAAFDANTGALKDNLGIGANGTVRALAADGETVYAGGAFFTFGDSRSRLAALDGATGELKDWNPGTNGTVFALAVVDGTVYAGGEFTQAGGESRLRLAAFDAKTGVLDTAWNPTPGGPDGSILTLDVSGDWLYAGGGFISVGGYTRNFLAAFDRRSGMLQPWQPTADGPVRALEVANDTVYVGVQCSGLLCSDYLAAFEASGYGRTKSSWEPNTNGSVYSLGVSGSAIYAGGEFTQLKGVLSISLAALDADSGALLPETFDIRGSVGSDVRAIAVSGSTLYVGGVFTYVNGATRSNLASFDAATGKVGAWNPNANGTVHSLVVSGQTLYAGGEFTEIGSVNREHLAAFSTNTGILDLNWNPGADGTVYAIAADNSRIYAGGEFASAGGSSRDRLAAFDAFSGTVDTGWSPGVDDTVRTLAAANGALYAGGDFLTAGGDGRNHLAAFDAVTGSVNATWNPGTDGPVYTLSVKDGTVYAGGEFATAGGASRLRLAAFDATTGVVAGSWNPEVDDPASSDPSPVYVLLVSGNTAYIGGDFLEAVDELRPRFTALDIITGELAW